MKMINHVVRIKPFGIILFLAAVFTCRQAEAVGGRVLTTDGQIIKATSIRFKKTTQEYILTTDNLERPLAKAKVKKLDIEKPAKFAQAITTLNSGKVDDAIAMFEEVYTEVFMLSPWDAQVLDMLGRIYTTKKIDKAKAVDTYEKLLRNALPEGITPDIKKRAWAVLIDAGKTEALAKEFENTIATGSRANAAAAYIGRGDLAKRTKNTSDAFIDYMRVVLLFDQVKDLQPEAMYKAMKCLEELKDSRAAELRRELAQKYPQSEYASKE